MAWIHKQLRRVGLKGASRIGRLMINAWDLSKILIKYKCAMNLIVAYSSAIVGN